jgi:sugar/nucleoside kinase (ribokinase family)
MNYQTKQASYDVTGIGSPLMDIIVEADESLLAALGLPKGGMTLIDEAQSADILSKIAALSAVRVPGGSAANTLAGVAMLGGKALFVGSVGSDDTARDYIARTESSGVTARLAQHDAFTGHAITFITSDGERTFATHLGAALRLSPADIDGKTIADSRILHIEGYLLEAGPLRDAAVGAMAAAKNAGTKVSIDLADPGVVSRNGDALRSIARDYADILFLNEEEARAFTGKEGHAAVEEVQSLCEIAVVKTGAKGSLVSYKGVISEIPSFPVKVVNTNGAGDNYAAGMLFGLTHGFDIIQAARIGSLAASRVVGVAGARLEKKFDPSEAL